MPLTTEQKAKITDAATLEAVEELERELSTRNYEAADRRTKLKKVEDEFKTFQGTHGTLIEKIKKLGFNPDEDIEAQFPVIIEKVTKDKGYKPSNEFDKLMQRIEKLSTEVTEWKGAAEREKRENQVEKAGTQFDPALSEAFGKSAPIVKELLKLKGQLTLKDGVPGIQNGEEFIPINAEKGKISAIDFVKQTYPDLVITKQKGGAGGSPSNKGAGGGGATEGMISRVEFEKLGGPEKLAYMTKYKTFTDNVTE
jgi:hypothetical protein